MKKPALIGAFLAVAILTPLSADDFGYTVDRLLSNQSNKWFGVRQPLYKPADASNYVPRQDAKAWERVLYADGLSVEYVTRGIAANGDMIAFWPNAENPTHLIVCIEVERNATGSNPGVQRVELKTGKVETILFGTKGCDGIRTTAWGTVIATEEEDDGHAYEILDPLNTTGHWIENRASGAIRTSVGGAATSSNVAQRQALPTMAWEGLGVLADGTLYAGDELRPGPNNTDGGAIFKFIPDVASVGGKITNLNQSPYVSGKTYAMIVSCVDKGSSAFPQFGQGCEVGTGAWVRVNPLSARADANAKGATGYYRPEDLHSDPNYVGPGARICWTNTGNEGAKHYAEVLCAIDENPRPQLPLEWAKDGTHSYLTAGTNNLAGTTTVVVNRFVEGDLRHNSFDNLDFQPKTGNVYIIEDHQYGEVIACLPDGDDRDIKSDGCVSILSVIDPSAEPTGFIFDASGRNAYVILQHGEQPAGLGATDDILKITGFKIRSFSQYTGDTE